MYSLTLATRSWDSWCVRLSRSTLAAQSTQWVVAGWAVISKVGRGGSASLLGTGWSMLLGCLPLLCLFYSPRNLPLFTSVFFHLDSKTAFTISAITLCVFTYPVLQGCSSHTFSHLCNIFFLVRLSQCHTASLHRRSPPGLRATSSSSNIFAVAGQPSALQALLTVLTRYPSTIMGAQILWPYRNPLGMYPDLEQNLSLSTQCLSIQFLTAVPSQRSDYSHTHAVSFWCASVQC